MARGFLPIAVILRCLRRFCFGAVSEYGDVSVGGSAFRLWLRRTGACIASMAVAIAPPEKRGSANSTFLCAYDIGIGIGGAIAGGLISSFGYETMFTGMSVFNLLSIVIYVLIGRNHPSSFSYRKRMAR